MGKQISPQRRLFAEEYIKDFNITQAAIRAGYSEKTAYSSGQRALKSVEVSNYIAEVIQKRSERTGVDAEWLLREAVDLYKECRAENDRVQANRALEIIGKHVDVQAFRERYEVEVHDKFESLEQARARAAATDRSRLQ